MLRLLFLYDFLFIAECICRQCHILCADERFFSNPLQTKKDFVSEASSILPSKNQSLEVKRYTILLRIFLFSIMERNLYQIHKDHLCYLK